MRALFVVPSLLLLGGCQSAAGLADCLGELAGLYEGALSGKLDGELQENGTMPLTFYDASGAVVMQGSVVVSETGGISGSAGDLDVGGSFDFEACLATGDWFSNADGGEGTWELSK